MLIKSIKLRVKKGVKFLQATYNFYELLFKDLNSLLNADILFILPYFQTGGAERVHLNIVKSVSDKHICILFTHNSATTNFKQDFSEFAYIIEINNILNKKNGFINTLLKKRLITTINNSKTLKSIFSSNTNFFYEILPGINEHITTIDLVHAVSNENKTLIEHYINSCQRINHRVVINKAASNAIVLNYNNYNVNKSVYNKLKIIENAIAINPDDSFYERENINIGFVGRWAKEKRPEIFLKIAKSLKGKAPNIDFYMAGIGMKSNIKAINDHNIEFVGELTDDKRLNNFYKSLTFLLIMSSREGFPMVIMEAMVQGVIPISTNVGGISEHIKSFDNGILIENSDHEEHLALQFVDVILKLIKDDELKKAISKKAYDYSRKHFNMEKFNQAYRALLTHEID